MRVPSACISLSATFQTLQQLADPVRDIVEHVPHQAAQAPAETSWRPEIALSAAGACPNLIGHAGRPVPGPGHAIEARQARPESPLSRHANGKTDDANPLSRSRSTPHIASNLFSFLCARSSLNSPQFCLHNVLRGEYASP